MEFEGTLELQASGLMEQPKFASACDPGNKNCSSSYMTLRSYGFSAEPGTYRQRINMRYDNITREAEAKSGLVGVRVFAPPGYSLLVWRS